MLTYPDWQFALPKTKALLWSIRRVLAFVDALSAISPWLTRGTLEDWTAFSNNKVCCERLIGRIKDVLDEEKAI